MSQQPATGTAPEGARKSVFRPDIQGLRAVAVIAVILDHLLHWPAGGFVGVDIFFVISGFLITSLLLRELEKTGTISFIGFYRRRIKRILPAATLVIVVTAAASLLLFNAHRGRETVIDGIWATLFGANWRFAAAGTDYFQADGPVSPLQHYWSLSVEEQFYFVWPWVMLGIFLFLVRSGSQKRARSAILTAIALISCGSFAWAVFETITNPTWAYFSTFSRAWELGIGALMAVAAGTLSRIPRAARPLLGWLGLVGIVISIFVVTDSIAFPAPWAALPVLSTALVIAAGTGGEQRFLWPLTNRASGYIGDISYSLYLWHFPVIVLLQSVFPDGGRRYYLACAASMLILTVLSYHLFEDRIRRSSWLDPAPGVRRRGGALRRPLGIVAATVTAAAVVAALTVVLTPARNPSTASPLSTDSSAPVTLSQLRTDLAAAAAASDWPSFDPPIENLAAQRVPQWTEHGCLAVSPENEDLCVYGATSPRKTAVVLGDSIATSWLPAVIGALEPMGYEIRSLTLQSCPVADTEVFLNRVKEIVHSECAPHQDWAAERVAAIDPDLILMSDSFLSIGRLTSKAKGDRAREEWVDAYERALASLPAETPKVALLTPPGAEDLASCYTPFSAPSDCMRPLQPNWSLLRDAEREAAEAGGATFIDTTPWFCVPEGCPAFWRTSAIYADSGHLTATYSARLAPVLAEALTASGITQ